MGKNLFQQQRGYRYFFYILLMFSCTNVKFTSKTSGQPKSEYYKFSKLHNYLTDPRIDTTVIYIYSDELISTYSNGKKELALYYRYLIFKKNGIVFLNNSSKVPFSQINIYGTRGQYCYYKVEDGELLLEMFDYNVKKFLILYGKILSDGILFYKDKLRVTGGGTGKQNMLFIKSSVKYNLPLIWAEQETPKSSE